MFEESSYNKLLYKSGIKGDGIKFNIIGTLIALGVFWLPLVIITLFEGTFWTGEITTSFISDFDVQGRLLITMPILILSDQSVSLKLALITKQFTNSGIVKKDLLSDFDIIIQKNTRFLKSRWTDLIVFIICYTQILFVVIYESSSTSLLTWQIFPPNEEPSLNLAGIWITFLSIPFVLFLIYRWLLRIFVWGRLLYKISKLDITLYPMHPDLAGGLGFLGFSIRYLSPIALAISATVAGNIADYMLTENVHLVDLKFLVFAYFLIITIIFVLPFFFFSKKLINAKEETVYEYTDFTNGLYRELRKKISKPYSDVIADDLKLPDYSAVADLNAVIDNALNMKFIPIKLKDIVPLWVMIVIPFVGVILIDIPLNEILKNVISLLM